MSRPPIEETDIAFSAPDGVALAGTLFSGGGSGPAVQLSSAAALERRFYRALALHLVAEGASRVLTYDYRGIGGSAAPNRKAPSAPFRMKDWGVLDFPAAHARLHAASDGADIAPAGLLRR